MIFLIGFTGFATAQGVEIDPLWDLSLEELLNINVTGATLTSESLLSVPAAVTIFTHQEIQHFGIDTLSDLILLVPGFQSFQTDSLSTDMAISSRGRRIGTSSAEILILLDGQRMNIPRTSGVSNIINRIPLSNIQQVEFIRGSGSAIYGSNAMMGVINIITRNQVNEVVFAAGSFQRREIGLSTEQIMNDFNVSLAINLTTDEGDEYQVPDNFSPNIVRTRDPVDSLDLLFKVENENYYLSLQHYQAVADEFYVGGFVANDINYNEVSMSYLTLKRNFETENSQSWLRLDYQRFSSRSDTQITPPFFFGTVLPASEPASNEPVLTFQDTDDFKEVRLHWHSDWRFSDNADFQAGIEARYLDMPEVILNSNFDLAALIMQQYPVSYFSGVTGETLLQASSERAVIGLYTQYQRSLGESANLTLGIRYDNFSDIGHELSPRVAWVQSLSEHQHLKLIYGRAFRAPTEVELNLANNPVLIGNDRLQPETVDSMELIWIGQWQDRLLSLGYFESHFDKAIAQVGVGGVQQYNNVDQDPVKGLEFEYTDQINDNWLIRGSYTYFIENSDLAYREADELASVMINYHNWRWNINFAASYQGERETSIGGDDKIRQTLKGYVLLFSKLSYNLTPDQKLFFQIKNMLGDQNKAPAFAANNSDGVPRRGRELLLGIEWAFD